MREVEVIGDNLYLSHFPGCLRSGKRKLNEEKGCGKGQDRSVLSLKTSGGWSL